MHLICKTYQNRSGYNNLYESGSTLRCPMLSTHRRFIRNARRDSRLFDTRPARTKTYKTISIVTARNCIAKTCYCGPKFKDPFQSYSKRLFLAMSRGACIWPLTATSQFLSTRAEPRETNSFLQGATFGIGLRFLLSWWHVYKLQLFKLQLFKLHL